MFRLIERRIELSV